MASMSEPLHLDRGIVISAFIYITNLYEPVSLMWTRSNLLMVVTSEFYNSLPSTSQISRKLGTLQG